MGTLVLVGSDGMSGSPLPFTVSSTSEGLRLFGHLDRQNPLAAELSSAQSVMIIFWGAGSYISPSFYTSSPRVPTWMFATCHAYGVTQAINDESELNDEMVRLTQELEPENSGWKLEQVASYKNRLLPAIQGFWVDVTRVDSQLRHGQHNSDEDQLSVMTSLQNGNKDAQGMANWIKGWKIQ